MIGMHQGERMKKIEAIISPFKLDQVKHALVESGVGGMTISEVNGCSADDASATMSYRGTEYVRAFQPKIKIDVVLTDGQVAAALAIITDAAQTNDRGAGHIFVSPVEEVIRIRTGERGVSALNGPKAVVATHPDTSHRHPVFVGDPPGTAQVH
jgi:nitrogen regulatory protein P-II 1